MVVLWFSYGFPLVFPWFSLPPRSRVHSADVRVSGLPARLAAWRATGYDRVPGRGPAKCRLRIWVLDGIEYSWHFWNIWFTHLKYSKSWVYQGQVSYNPMFGTMDFIVSINQHYQHYPAVRNNPAGGDLWLWYL